MLFYQLAQVDQRIAHTTQRGIDTHVGILRYLLKAEVEIMAEHHHFFLLLRQHLYQVLQLVFTFHHIQVDVVRHFIKLHVLKDIVTLTGHDAGPALYLAEIVDAQVVGYAHHPLDKLALVVILARAQCIYHLDVGLLKDILRQVGVFHHHVDRSIDLVFVAGYKALKSCFIACEVLAEQFLVCHERCAHRRTVLSGDLKSRVYVLIGDSFLSME